MSSRSTTWVFPFDLRIAALVCVAFLAIVTITVFGQDFRILFGGRSLESAAAEKVEPVLGDYTLRHPTLQR